MTNQIVTIFPDIFLLVDGTYLQLAFCSCFSKSVLKLFVFDGLKFCLLMILKKVGVKEWTKLCIKEVSNNGQSGTVSYQRMAV